MVLGQIIDQPRIGLVGHEVGARLGRRARIEVAVPQVQAPNPFVVQQVLVLIECRIEAGPEHRFCLRRRHAQTQCFKRTNLGHQPNDKGDDLGPGSLIIPSPSLAITGA